MPDHHRAALSATHRRFPVSRLQLALNVADVDAAVEFYTTLFDTAPAKRRPGYANFAVVDPPLAGAAAAPMEPEDKLYRTDDGEVGVRQFLVQDPDGYLVRFSEHLGRRRQWVTARASSA